MNEELLIARKTFAESDKRKADWCHYVATVERIRRNR